MVKTISFIGGDYRIVKLIQMMKNDSFKVKTYGMEKCDEITEEEKKANIEDCINESEIIISGIPFSKDEKTVYMPFSDEVLEIEELLSKVKGKKLIAGNINKFIFNKEISCYDLMENEALTIANATSTAEGAIQIAMEETEITLHDAEILILGFGRIGKILAKDLQGLGAKVTCEARKEKDLTWINAYGYNAIHLKQLKENLNKFEVIFNTIPNVILDKDMLHNINKKCLIIDLASKPGGVDFDECIKLGIKCKWTLAIPGKVAPITSARWMKKIIYDVININ